jgi:hypothetical protein
MGIIAAGVSAPTTLSGQKDRSGPDFSLLGNNNDQITITSTTGGNFDIKQDKGGSDPTPVPNANGKIISGNTLPAGNNYYIANPKNATESFSVTLSQD